MKCKPEDVPAEAVEEYAKVLIREWFLSEGFGKTTQQPDGGTHAEARRAIADGAEPEGWEWIWDPKFGRGAYLLVRKSPPKPEPTEVELAQAAAGDAISEWEREMHTSDMVRSLRALRAYIDAVAKAVKS